MFEETIIPIFSLINVLAIFSLSPGASLRHDAACEVVFEGTLQQFFLSLFASFALLVAVAK